MSRQELINRIVARKLQNAGTDKNLCFVQRVGCVPCFGAASRRPAAKR